MLEDFSVGQIVFSKAGRDKKRAFVVLNVNENYLFLSDGALRTVEKPKKKKIMHVQPTKTIAHEVTKIIDSGGLLKNSDIRTALKKFLI